MQNITLSGLSRTPPAHVLRAREARTGGTCVITMPGASKPLYQVAPHMKERTVEQLIKHALERLKPFGIVDLSSWNIEVCELDAEDYQVDIFNNLGAGFSVDRIWMTANKCGVSGDHGVSAFVDRS